MKKFFAVIAVAAVALLVFASPASAAGSGGDGNVSTAVPPAHAEDTPHFSMTPVVAEECVLPPAGKGAETLGTLYTLVPWYEMTAEQFETLYGVPISFSATINGVFFPQWSFPATWWVAAGESLTVTATSQYGTADDDDPQTRVVVAKHCTAPLVPPVMVTPVPTTTSTTTAIPAVVPQAPAPVVTPVPTTSQPQPKAAPAPTTPTATPSTLPSTGSSQQTPAILALAVAFLVVGCTLAKLGGPRPRRTAH